MSDKEEIVPIILKEKYAGGSENGSLTNYDILQLTNQQSSIIYGPTQFAMKYRVLPCTMTEKLEQGTYNAQEMFSSGLNSIYARANRHLRTSKRKKNGWRHITR